MVRRAPETEAWNDPAAPADRTGALRLMLAVIDRLRAEVETDGGRVVLVIHPSKQSYRSGSDWVQALLRVASVEDLPTLDLAAAYRAAGLRFGSLGMDDEGLLTPRGHAFAARSLSRFVDAQREDIGITRSPLSSGTRR